MPWKVIAGAALLSLIVGACSSTRQSSQPDTSGLTGEELAVRMEAYMTPGAAQAQLMERVGTWTVLSSMWAEPGGEPMLTEGHAVFEPVMDGRYLREKLSSTAMGMPFLGEGLSGFDNATDQYVTVWVDSMGTGLVFATGSGDTDGHVIQLEGTMTDPIHGGTLHARFVTTRISIDEYRFEIWMKATKKQLEWKSMESTYTRS